MSMRQWAAVELCNPQALTFVVMATPEDLASNMEFIIQVCWVVREANRPDYAISLHPTGSCPLGQCSGVVVVAADLLLQVLMVEVAVVAVGPVALLLPSLGIGHPLVGCTLRFACKVQRRTPASSVRIAGP